MSFNLSFLGFSFEIGATIVGVVTICLIFKQMGDQRKLNQRIADMQYTKLMEDKLLAIVYSDKQAAGQQETVHSAPSMEWYKFNFMQGYVSRDAGGTRKMIYIFPVEGKDNVDKNGYTFNQIYFKEPLRGDYLKTYTSMIKNIVEDLIV